MKNERGQLKYLIELRDIIREELIAHGQLEVRPTSKRGRAAAFGAERSLKSGGRTTGYAASASSMRVM